MRGKLPCTPDCTLCNFAPGQRACQPCHQSQALVGGTASAGTLICIIRVITKASAPETVDGLRRSSDAYFFMAAAIALACFIVTGWVRPRLEVYKYWRAVKLREGEACNLAAAAWARHVGGVPAEGVHMSRRPLACYCSPCTQPGLSGTNSSLPPTPNGTVCAQRRAACRLHHPTTI